MNQKYYHYNDTIFLTSIHKCCFTHLYRLYYVIICTPRLFTICMIGIFTQAHIDNITIKRKLSLSMFNLVT